MDALTLLIGDHNRVKGLSARFQAAHEAEDQDTAVLVATAIFQELEVHTTIEETVFYPAITDLSDEIHELVVEGIEEHNVVKNLIAECKAMDPSDEHWAAKVTVMVENVDHHVEEEESEMFPMVRSASEGNFLEELAERLEAKKAELGAPTLRDKIDLDLTKAELDELAKKAEIPGRSSMTKDELLATVGPLAQR